MAEAPEVRVRIPTPLRSYTSGAANVRARGRSTGEVLDDLDRQFPGLRFRVVDEQGAVRPHMVLWVRGERSRDLAAPLEPGEELVLMQALSGG